MVRSLLKNPVDKNYNHPDCIYCPEELQPQVFELAAKTHFHNRYMYDPEVEPRRLRQFITDTFQGLHSVLIITAWSSCITAGVEGFLFYKFNL